MRAANEQNIVAQARGGSVRLQPNSSGATARGQAARKAGTLPLAFAGLWLFTLLLYVRPNDVFPELLGDFQLVKVVAIPTVLAYLLGRLARGEAISIWTPEFKMVLVIWFLGALFMPLAAAPGDSWEMLFDHYLKVVLIFMLLINLLDTRRRLNSILKLVVIWGTVLAIDAIRNFATGQFAKSDELRINGLVSGIFGNPNDLATALNLLLPLAVALALNQRGVRRFFYFTCAALTGMGVIATFSRGGFLGLLAVGAVLLWKLGQKQQATAVATAVGVIAMFLLFMPGSYSSRITTIISTNDDATGSAQERREILKRAVVVAIRHPIIGVGMGNFHIYSLKEKVAHNAYVEIAAELGIFGLLAYLALIFKPLGSLRQIERETGSVLQAEATATGPPDKRLRETYYLSIALQGAFAAYIVCTLFGSVQYQWFLYYIAAYAVAVRRIHAAEQEEQATLVEAQPAASVLQDKSHGRRVRPRTRLGLLRWSGAETNGASSKITIN